MVEDAPIETEHGHQRCVMGTIRAAVLREVPIREIN